METLSMSKKIFSTLGVVCLALSLSGCFNKSKLPLSRWEDAQPDKALAGAWRAVVDGKDVYLHVIPYPEDHPEKAWMQLAHVVQPPGGSPGRGEDAILLHMFPTAAKGRKFMNVLFRKPHNTKDGRCEVEEYYWFWKYELSRDGVLTVWELEEEGSRLAVEDGKLKGAYKNSVQLEDSGENILAYLLSVEGEKSFHLYGKFKKIR
jgi:hypothetical protein